MATGFRSDKLRLTDRIIQFLEICRAYSSFSLATFCCRSSPGFVAISFRLTALLNGVDAMLAWCNAVRRSVKSMGRELGHAKSLAEASINFVIAEISVRSRDAGSETAWAERLTIARVRFDLVVLEADRYSSKAVLVDDGML